mmetsp:Transcript_50526/g.152217  ORF Transcript_50526/g.152217 Transcript_50526/m.152217 type:complete len:851 (-) Transcript_50526:98-2650(-)
MDPRYDHGGGGGSSPPGGAGGTNGGDSYGNYDDGNLSAEAAGYGRGGPRSGGGGGNGGGGGVNGGPSVDPGGGDADAARMRDIASLHILCETATEDDPASWDAVRNWLRSHGADAARQGAERLGEYNTTPLHLACRNCPPVDVVDVLLSAAPDTVRWEDSFGWLPLHYACANGASEDVLRILAEAFPDSRTATDRRGRTPLHFTLGNTDRPAAPAAVVLLASTGAAACSDENGMLPLHYACAYGASEEALHILTDGNVDSITATDRKGRTPLHFALGNADRPASPAVVRLLLSQNREVVNATDKEGGQLPLHLLATRANTLNEGQKPERDNAEKCLLLYLGAEPKPTADFLTALQALPDWLGERAVVHPIVQGLLNEKISQRFPTAVILLDFYFLIIVIATYSVTVLEAINQRYSAPEGALPSEKALPNGFKLIPLYIGAMYFLLREVVQMLSLLSLGLFQTWLYDPTNWLDVAFIALVVVWSVLMQTGLGNDDTFRTGTALSLLILWVNVLSFLKSMFIDFAVFVGGVLYVVQRLAAFLMALGVILVAFAQMFVTLFRQTEYCNCQPDWDDFDDENDCDLDKGEPRPFCSDLKTSFLKVYTMLLGEVDETLFYSSKFALVLFVVFMFLVVILLANVLIAIVTDSYGVIKNERAAIVFWSNRLDFVAEMDAIAAGPWKKKLMGTISGSQGNKRSSHGGKDSSWELWKKLMDLFEDDIQELSVFSMEFWCYSFLRFVVALFFVPVWLILGIFSAGWLWPPQVRAGLLVQRISKRNPGDLKEAEQRTKEIKELRKEVKDLQGEVVSEMAADRKEVVAMKSQLNDMRSDVMNQMKEIKQVMTMLFDLQSSMDA